MAKRSAMKLTVAQTAQLDSIEMSAVRRNMALSDWKYRLTDLQADYLRAWFRSIYDKRACIAHTEYLRSNGAARKRAARSKRRG